jgi:adenylate kinase
MSDEMIKDRNMNLPESVVSGTKYAEEQLVKRLEEFRAVNHDENTVLNYYDENDAHPIELDVASLYDIMTGLEGAVDQMLAIAVEKIGPPRNYGPTYEQLADLKRKKEDQAVLSKVLILSAVGGGNGRRRTRKKGKGRSRTSQQKCPRLELPFRRSAKART